MILLKTLFLGQAVDASMLSLPLLAGMTDEDVKDVTKAVWERPLEAQHLEKGLTQTER
jgi:hypothetical protein